MLVMGVRGRVEALLAVSVVVLVGSLLAVSSPVMVRVDSGWLAAAGSRLVDGLVADEPLADGLVTVESGSGALVSEVEAVGRAVNDVVASDVGVVVSNPSHTAVFGREGLSFTANRGLEWGWSLDSIVVGSELVGSAAVVPTVESGRVVYGRGAVVERYVLGVSSVEQQFVIREPLGVGDVVIEGVVDSVGVFESAGDGSGWVWSDPVLGSVSLGDVTVFDAVGSTLEAEMVVSAGSTRIVVDGQSLTGAVFPVVVDPEIGANDFRVSDMDPVDNAFDAFDPAVAYNSIDNEYLVVWSGDDDTGTLVDNEFEIFGQRIDATTGAEIGSDFRISDMGPDGNTSSAFSAFQPAVAYNPSANEYLVVWSSGDDTGGLVAGEFEIFGQRIAAATGAEVGVNDFRISDMGPDGNRFYNAFVPAVAYNSTNDEFLVVWSGDDDTGTLVDGEQEVFGQRLDAAGVEVGVNDFRLSDMGPDGSSFYDAFDPAVAYNSTNNEYLVVWWGDDDTGTLVQGEFEIFGQRLTAANGAEAGANDFRVSDMGPDGGGDPFTARLPAVAYNPTDSEYLVVWMGTDDSTGDVEYEIYGQRLTAATAVEVGSNDLRISDMGPDNELGFSADTPAVSHNSIDNEYLVVWLGDDDTGSLISNEREIFGQRVDAATGVEVGVNDFRVSDMGPDGSAGFGAFNPAVVYNPSDNEFLVVWEGDDDTGALVDEEFEVFGQRIDAATGAEVGVNDFRVSSAGPDGDLLFDALDPVVAYNPAANEYLVVWSGDDDTGGLVDNEFEIFGQRIDAATGAEVGVNDFRISDMGPDGSNAFFAFNPAVVYNPINDEYLVVWEGDDDTGSLVDDELEIFGQRLDATGVEVGANDFRVSDMGPDGDVDFAARAPAAAHNSVNNEYLVVWWGDDDTGTLVNNDLEIFGQRLTAANGVEIGGDFQISDMGPDGEFLFRASDPAVAYNPVDNEFLVVWSGDDDTGALIDGEFEIFGQRIASATGAEVGVNDFRISDMGAEGNAGFDAEHPEVAHNPVDNEFLVVWSGDDDTGGLVDGELEVFGQRLTATGAEVGVNDFRISDMGPDGSSVGFGAFDPAVAYDPVVDEFLVVWSGDDDTGGLVNNENEIFGQRLTAAAGAEVGVNDFRLSDMGPNGSIVFDAVAPAVAASSGEFLVVWSGDDDTGGLVDNEFEIFGQLLEVPVCAGLPVTVDIGAGQTPTAGDDVILGTLGPDVIDAGEGDDTVCARDGDDTVIGGPGDDVIFAGGGDDLVSGNAGADTIDAGGGKDSVFGGSGNDVITGGGGDDVLLGGGSDRDRVDGGPGDDRINGGSDDDFRVDGGVGADTVVGGGGNDALVFGGDGDDQVAGNGGKDVLFGEAGNDTMFGGPNDDELYGGDGDDFLGGNDGVDICDGGPEVTADVAAGNCETLIDIP